MIGRTKNRARSRRKNSSAWTAVIAAAGVLAVAAVAMGGVYIYKGKKYKDCLLYTSYAGGIYGYLWGE